MKKPMLIIGAGGHAKILIDIIQKSDEYSLKAVIGKENEEHNELMGYKIYKGDKYLSEFKDAGITSIAIGIGGYTNNEKRKAIYCKLKSTGFEIVNLIDPSSVVSASVKLGDGVVIFAGVIINPEVIIGNNVVIATGATIDHETIVEDHVLISAGVTVGAGDIIKEGALLALGSKIISRVTIGENALVASGAMVVNDIAKNTTVYGVPAKPKQ